MAVLSECCSWAHGVFSSIIGFASGTKNQIINAEQVNMKIEWQAKDIKAGRRVGHPNHSEQWMIGYMGSMTSDEARWALISLSDGMIQTPVTRENLAVTLNSTGDIPLEFIASPQSKGGKARSASMSMAKRQFQAIAAANARWNGGGGTGG